jgi:Protein of unknown function (DUF642)
MSTHLKASLILGSIVGAALMVGSTAQASPVNLIKDGSFETPKISTWYQDYGKKPTGAFAGDSWSGHSFDANWLISPNNVDIVNSNFAPGNAPAAKGVQYLDLVGYGSTGGISQLFKTDPGTTYTLTFDYANNPWSTNAANPPSAQVDVFSIFGLLAQGTISHGTSTTTDLGWTVDTLTFTANFFVTDLTFLTTAGSNSGGILLDAVSVVDPISSAPIPGTAMLFAGGLGLLGFMAWSRKRRDSLMAAACA